MCCLTNMTFRWMAAFNRHEEEMLHSSRVQVPILKRHIFRHSGVEFRLINVIIAPSRSAAAVGTAHRQLDSKHEHHSRQDSCYRIRGFCPRYGAASGST